MAQARHELTKLDLERKLKTRAPADATPVRPSILDFLANYRDLQELGAKSPKQLYATIKEKRVSAPARAPAAPAAPAAAAPPPGKRPLWSGTRRAPTRGG